MKKKAAKKKATKKASKAPSKHSPRAKTRGRKNIRGAYPNLNPSKNLKIRQEMMEGMEYVKTLNEKDKDYMDKFMGGYNNADFRKGKKHPIHKTKKARSICHAINNSRNKDVYARSKSKAQLMYDNTPDYWMHIDETTNKNSHEDTALDLLDISNGQPIIVAESVSFIKEVKDTEKSLLPLMVELRAASSMVATMLSNLRDGEMAPTQIGERLKEGVESLLQWQSSGVDVNDDTKDLREELLKYAHLIEKQE